MTGALYLIIIALLAAALYYGLARWAAHILSRRSGAERKPPAGAVYLGKNYAPIPTWLKLVFLPALGRSWQWMLARLGALVNRTHSRLAQLWASRTTWRGLLLEIAIIIFAVLLYAGRILDLNAPTRLPGNESEVFQALDWVLVNGLHDGAFPLWNPYLQTGLPYIADPMLHVYNPVVTIPVLLLGVRAGFKLGVFISFVIAALGMWQLGRQLGLGQAVRVWMAIMFAFAGQPAARFFQGQYLFILGFAWIPWIIAFLLKIRKSEGQARRRAVILMAVSVALLFFSGNAYYQFFMLLACSLFALLTGFSANRKKPYLRLDKGLAGSYLGVVLIALGLVAVQLMPSAQFWSRVSKDPNVEGSHTFKQIFLDYTSKDSSRPDAYNDLPAREEFYAYIGLAPFLALALLPLAWKKQPRPLLIFFFLLLLLTVGWIGMGHWPWAKALATSHLVNQFRHLLRILIFGSFALIALASTGLDALWQIFEGAANTTQGRYRSVLAYGGLVILSLFMLFGVIDVYNTNRQSIRTQDEYSPAYHVTGWLRQHDGQAYYTRHNPNNAWTDAYISQGLRFIQNWYHFADIRNTPSAINTRPVQASPHYIVQSQDEADPAGGQFVAKVNGYNVFSMPQALPMAFSVAGNELQRPYSEGLLTTDLVTAQEAYFPTPNRAQVMASGQAGEVLVLLVTHYPGWQVTVDGKSQALLNVSGYMATAIQPGLHHYEFSFRPVPFYAGLAISLATGLLALALFIGRAALRRPAELAASSAQPDLAAASEASYSPASAIDAQPAPAISEIPNAAPGKPLSHAYTVTVGQPAEESPGPETNISLSIHLPPGQGVSLNIEVPPGGSQLQVRALPADLPVDIQAGAKRAHTPMRKQAHIQTPTQAPARTTAWRLSLAGSLFALGLFIYLLTRLVGLQDWPIYFFTDEAVHTMLASDLLRDGLRNYDDDLLPAFFENGGKYRLGFTVYVHALSYLFFGKSVFITRATSAIVTLAAAAAASLTLRHAFKLKNWWSGVLFLSIIPAWFLHSRTAFEYAMAVTFYALFIYCYLCYRLPAQAHPAQGAAAHPDIPNSQALRSLYFALLFGALAFYSYSPMQLVVVVSGAILGLSDLRYHLSLFRHPETRRAALGALAWLALLVAPYLRFMLAHPEANEVSLKALGAYWYSTLSPLEKLAAYFKEYIKGLNPLYWFDPAGNGLVRHLMKGYSHISFATLPLIVIGLLACLKHWRLPAHRTVLAALLAAPAGAALVEIGITRILVMVIPAALLTAIGAEYLLDWIAERISSFSLQPKAGAKPFALPVASVSQGLTLLLAAILAVTNLAMLRDALANGPTWYTDYTLGGMQYGARQIFPAAVDYANAHPGVRIIVSPDWSNGTDVVSRFFTPDPTPYQLGVIDAYINNHLSLDENTVFVMTPEEYERATSSEKFQDIQVEQTLPYPDGRPGFYFVRLRYVDNIDEILVEEIAQRRVLQQDTVFIDGQAFPIQFSRLDMGKPAAAFDGDPDTVIRTLEANPLVLELTFPTARTINGLSAIIGSANMRITALAYSSPDAEPITYGTTIRGSVEQPLAELPFNPPISVVKLRIEFLDLNQQEPAHVHIWEIELK
ncbi:MAG TPA: hypothetical protein PKM21_08680 [Anaerolineales bacterium]|nr:hypothetical protein [Anaerolineales bacterium]